MTPMPQGNSRKGERQAPANQWLVLEPNRIEKQYWKDLWRYRELFALNLGSGQGHSLPYELSAWVGAPCCWW